MVTLVVGCRLLSKENQLFSSMSSADQHRLTSAKRHI